MSAVRDVAWAWSKGQAFNITSNSSAPTDGVEFVECVTPNARLVDADVWAFRSYGQQLLNVAMYGCYIAPSYKLAGSSAHCDTLQLSGSPEKKGLLIRDSVIFSSTNAGLIPSDAATNILFDNSLVVGGDRMTQRYPLPAGANQFTSGFPSAVNGSGSVNQLSGLNSTFIGGVSGTWLEVTNCLVSSTSLPKATRGAFTAKPDLASVNAAWIEGVAPTPSDTRLKAMWAL